MTRVVPSQVVQFISSLPITHPSGTVLMNSIGPAAICCILELVEQIPGELLVMEPTTYVSFVHARMELKDVLAAWRANQQAGQQLQRYAYNVKMSPLAQIRDALAKCPDESPAPSTSELAFIADADLRANLRIDIGAVNRALSNGEWKAATVLAGSAIEALLLWKLQQRPQAYVIAAVDALPTIGKPDASNLERWDLHQFTEVAAHLGVIKQDTATEARLAREFRNLIHPGRAERLAQKCDRGTALSCVAALEHVLRDLS